MNLVVHSAFSYKILLIWNSFEMQLMVANYSYLITLKIKIFYNNRGGIIYRIPTTHKFTNIRLIIIEAR